jgi:hypothetical protein
MVPDRADLSFRLRGAFPNAAKEEKSMSISRRQFLLSTVAGASFILPSFYHQAIQFFEQYEKPLIVPPRQFKNELLAVDWSGDQRYVLNFGDPDEVPPFMTWQEYYETYGCDRPLEDFLSDWELKESELQEDVDYGIVIDSWALHDSPTSQAYFALVDLDLGDDFESPDAVGELLFIDGACPGNDFRGVQAVGDVSLSLLQNRLNALDTGYQIRVAQ